ncbi:hypothetical protein [Cyanobium gracile]|uniref:Uncharacterized protein n=1 Tax=Cyanobium gracile (strain ATCC 27147 / PCC 6307) TaxID=292564 RepID=K9P952_CYAGP|nr:hypothetical protein [Cyanobium gracile]AFY29907.1 hypothetical protein Cyagr_2815 [Cyanobium gracile PCC 6307]
MDESSEFKGYEASILADRLSLSSLALLILYIAAAGAALLPLALLNADWQLRAIRTLLDTAFLPLLALGLLHLGAYLDPQNPVLQKRRMLVARLAIIAVVGFLLFIPLQMSAAWRTVAAGNANASRQLARANETFNILRDIIVQAPTLNDLQERLDNQENRGVRLNLEAKGVSLEQTKKELLEQLAVVRDAVIARVNKPDRQATEALARESVRVVISSLALALAFSAAAQRKGSSVPLLVEWHTLLVLRGAHKADADNPLSKSLSLGTRSRPIEDNYIEQLVPAEDEPPKQG